MGSGLYSLYETGTAAAEGGSITEGIGQGRITANLEGFTPDMRFQIPDDEALPVIFDLLQDEGLCLVARPASTWPAHAHGARDGTGPHDRDRSM